MEVLINYRLFPQLFIYVKDTDREAVHCWISPTEVKRFHIFPSTPSRSSHTPRVLWTWEALSSKVGLVSPPPCPHETCLCTSTTHRSQTPAVTSARSSSLITLATLLSWHWTWRVRFKLQTRRCVQSNRMSVFIHLIFLLQCPLMFLSALSQGSQCWKETWRWAARPVLGNHFLCTSGGRPAPPLKSSSLPCWVSGACSLMSACLTVQYQYLRFSKMI